VHPRPYGFLLEGFLKLGFHLVGGIAILALWMSFRLCIYGCQYLLLFSCITPLGVLWWSWTQDNHDKWGVGMVLILEEGKILKMWMGCGPSSNTNVELLALWGLLLLPIKNMSLIWMLRGTQRWLLIGPLTSVLFRYIFWRGRFQLLVVVWVYQVLYFFSSDYQVLYEYAFISFVWSNVSIN